jgi:hypothetical protein
VGNEKQSEREKNEGSNFFMRNGESTQSSYEIGWCLPAAAFLDEAPAMVKRVSAMNGLCDGCFIVRFVVRVKCQRSK